MKKIVIFVMALVAIACADSEREVVILSTNDIHAHIEQFPKLATAVERCRDTAEVILVDAGDRWTGNAYVDLVEDRRPIVELMNSLGYDLATLGNHEFDFGQESLERVLRDFDFPVICANVVTSKESALRPIESSRIIRRGGIDVGFTGVVTSYGPNSHPDGHDDKFVGLTFPDAVQTAVESLQTIDSLSDVKVLLSHAGLERDIEIAQRADYNTIIGAHTHNDTTAFVGSVLISQTGKNLRKVGVTVLRKSANGALSLAARTVALDGYPAHPEYEKMVCAYFDNPDLKVAVGSLASDATRIGLANLFAQSVMSSSGADIGIYHYGGVRMDSLPMGDVPLAAIYDLDPFNSFVSVAQMSVEQLRKMIIAKFNDTVKPSEAHCIDLFATIPYVVVTDGYDAVDVKFPTLDEKHTYRVAMGDYVMKNYVGAKGSGAEVLDVKVTDALLKSLSEGKYQPCNDALQSVRAGK